MKNIRTLFALMRRVGNVCNCSMATRTNATAFIYTIIYSSAQTEESDMNLQILRFYPYKI
jgi:hypothetical protein